MSKVHYVVRRSRMGRFNFTLISEAGRITGSVVVSTAGRTGTEIESDARERIRRLAETFAATVRPALPAGDDTASIDGRPANASPRPRDRIVRLHRRGLAKPIPAIPIAAR